MDKTEQQIQRAEQALQILNNPLFAQAFEDTRAAIMQAWATLSPADEKRSEHSADLHRMIRALDKVKFCLEEHVTTGKMAAKVLEAPRNLLGRVK
jgi:soluble cytochrome b562